MGVVFNTETTIDQLADTVDITIEQGSFFSWDILCNVPMATGKGITQLRAWNRAYMQVRPSWDSDTLYLYLDSATDDFINIDDADTSAVVVTVELPSEETQNITLTGVGLPRNNQPRTVGTGQYDLYVVLDDGEHYRILEGTVTISPRVSRVVIS